MTVRLDDLATGFVQHCDFIPVCTTELGAVAKLKPEFDRRNIKVIGLSVDTIADHWKWAKDIEKTPRARLNFLLLVDADRKVATLYDIIHPNASDTLMVHSVYLIGLDKKVKLTLTSPASIGCSFQELLRVIDSLQWTSSYKVATGVNWRQGDDSIILPAVTGAEADEALPKGYHKIKLPVDYPAAKLP